MFNWFKKDTPPVVVKSKYWIDYYPVKDVYYPRYDKGYMKTCFRTGIIEIDYDSFTGQLYGDHFNDKDDALAKITEHKEQQNAELRVRIDVD